MPPQFLSDKEYIKPRTAAIIAAAGSSTRMGEGFGNKQLLMLGDMPVLGRTVLAFENSEIIDEIVLVTHEKYIIDISKLVQDMEFTKVTNIVRGAATRQQSVARGLQYISANCNFAAIHDGARPFIRQRDIESVCKAAYEYGAAALGTPVKDTLKTVDDNLNIINTVDRSRTWAVQTPQVFSLSLYRAALFEAEKAKGEYSDDCQLFERFGGRIRIVEGSYNNIKITTPEDLSFAEYFLECEMGD